MAEDSVAQDQIRAFVDRILRMKEEAKAINDDIRDIYAEAKGNGFDKTALGQLVTYVGKRQAGAAELQEREALFDLYLAAYDGSPSRTHAYARQEPQPEQNSRSVPPRTGAAVGNEAVAPAAQSDAPEDSDPPKLEGSLAGAIPSTVHPQRSDEAGLPGAAAPGAMQEGSEPIGAHNPDKAGSTPAPATNLPKMATEARQGTPAPEAEVGKPEAASGVQTTRVMTVTPLEKREVNGLKGFGFSVKWDDKPLRPNCQHPDHCASPGGNKLCWSCTKAASLTGENAA